MLIYYDTGQVYAAEPALAPPMGAQVIRQQEPGKDAPSILHGFDYYWLNADGLWQGADTFGMMDLILHRFPAVRKVIAGRTIPNYEFQSILKRAVGAG